LYFHGHKNTLNMLSPQTTIKSSIKIIPKIQSRKK